MTGDAAPGAIRFGISAPGFDSLEALVARARWAERAGFSTFSVSDHLNAPSPFVTLQAIAGVTERIRLGTLVINNDLRHPVVLAQDAATVDRLSGGRLELGLGAGWALAEYRRAGIAYDAPSVRIERLAETVGVLRALFSGEPVSVRGRHVQLDGHFVVPRPPQAERLPLLIGGNGDRLLRLAAEEADIVGFTGFSPDRQGHNVRSHFSRAGLTDRVALVQRCSADRAVRPERNILLQQLTITEDREYLAEAIARRHGTTLVDVLTCPFLALGTIEDICLQLTRLRDDLAITSVTVFNPHADDAAKVIAALGTAAP
ncbi:MAG: TIGR03621 family F420-dependent LLM class oxidoreductase [Acidimicrobiales bacterium]|nr:TIGR03621 family F420-dependent LLM class oxidoreductase [Acidimicrobiales bacterium]